MGISSQLNQKAEANIINDAIAFASLRQYLQEITLRFYGRRCATQSDRKFREYLEDKLKSFRLEVTQQTFPSYGGAYASYCFHVILGLAACYFLSLPTFLWLGWVSLGIVCVSFALELNSRVLILRRLLPRATTANVIARSLRINAKKRIVICAHHDAGHCGFIYRGRASSIGKKKSIMQWFLFPAREPYLFALIGLLLLGLLTSNLLKLPGWLPIVLRILCLSYLGLFLFLFGQVAGWGPISPSANDNASGVATLLMLAQRRKELPEFQDKDYEWWFVATGAEEQAAQGMKRFISRYAKDWPRDKTLFILLDSTGWGEPQFLTEEGILWPKARVSQRTLDNIHSLKEAFSEAQDLKPHTIYNTYSDALPVWRAGFEGTLFLTTHPTRNYYHSLEDTPEHVDVVTMQKIMMISLGFIKQWQNTPIS